VVACRGDAGEIGRLTASAKVRSGHGWRRTGSPAIGEEPARIAVSLPATSAAGLRAPPLARARPVPCCPCPTTAQDATGLVDGGDWEEQRLADPQAAAVNQAEHRGVSIADRGEMRRTSAWKASAAAASAWEAGSFFKQRPVWPSVFR